MIKSLPIVPADDSVSVSAFAAENFQHEWAHSHVESAHAYRQNQHLEFGECQVALVPCTARNSSVGRPEVYVLSLSWSELIARFRGKTNVPSAEMQSEVVRFGEVEFNRLSLDTYRSGELVKLTAMELKVLRFFVSHPNQVITREDLLNQVWGYDNYPCTRTVDTHVFRLRQKLETDMTRPMHFRTIHCMGYKFVP